MYSSVPEYDVAFGSVHQHYHKRLHYFANGIIKDSVEAKMIVTDVFTSAYENREDFTNGPKIYPLLRFMVRNHCIDYIRHWRSEERRRKEFAYVEDTQTDGLPAYELAGEKAEFMEMAAVMREELGRLPKKSQAILRATILEGRPIKEYARAEGIKLSSAHNLRKFALRLLKKRMLARGFDMLLILLVLMLKELKK